MRFIDPCYPLVFGTPNFSGVPQIRFRLHNLMPSASLNVTALTLSTQQYTHADTPNHYFGKGNEIDEVAFERFFCSAILIDLAQSGAVLRESVLKVFHFGSFATASPSGAFVICLLGSDCRFCRKQYFPYFLCLTNAAARRMAVERIGLFWMDAFETVTDYLACCHTLQGPGVEFVILEGFLSLVRMHARFMSIALPLRNSNRDRAPVGTVAWSD